MANNQNLADAREVMVAGFLILAGFNVSKPLSGASKYVFIVEKKGVCIKAQVKNLKRDPEYKKSPSPVYNIDASCTDIETGKQIPYKPTEVDVIIGYNIEERCFAAVPLADFDGKTSAVVHAKDGLRANYFHSWSALDDMVTQALGEK
ncbi:hypothetical protein GTO89_13175 [Heliobacterium gestii]|uniref:PD(D/E)XK endonuclease domain-containing protein n=1 Tax=Heliomicrobium gestii TaxID=2699 RepID=A0A845LF10_HELGE|nr:group I intron-associated PD-(D/E)XK endonuclease [Heliomicrobium gestii]MBM7867467.1 hypothetical protein [Heliomicrobium gestii]MZP43984.1 hypothetical protein [Heliomicrobium gestii]